ncbi:MAG: TolB family protein [Planctomycetaceae bacterium]
MLGILMRVTFHAVFVVAIMIWSTSVRSEESEFIPRQNAYNAIPSPDGTKVAFVQTGRGRAGSGGFGRSNLRSDVMVSDVQGNLLSKEPLADSFLAGWTPDGKSLVCYRDWQFFLVALDGTKTQAGKIPDQESRPERVVYHSATGRFLWPERDRGIGIVRNDEGQELARHESLLGHLALSNDGKWLAAISGNLKVLNVAAQTWADLGPVTIHPLHGNWDYIKPSWNPWFDDSSHLAFVSGEEVVVATPDGKQKRTLCQLPSLGGLASASPDGKHVAYVTFEEGKSERRRDLTFCGNARVWVVSTLQPDKPQAVTEENPDSIYGIRWMNAEEVIFDRIADTPFYNRARLWRATVPHESE